MTPGLLREAGARAGLVTTRYVCGETHSASHSRQAPLDIPLGMWEADGHIGMRPQVEWEGARASGSDVTSTKAWRCGVPIPCEDANEKLREAMEPMAVCALTAV